MGKSFEESLQTFVGRPPGPPSRAPDPVNQPMIRHWCDAVGDANPVYTDPKAAARSRHGGLVAPPAMLQVWTMRGLRRAEVPGGEDVIGRLFALLDEAGFTSIVATDCEQEYRRYLRPGDHVTVSGVIESVSGEKRTALGDGHFVTWLDTFQTDVGEVVGTMRFRVLKFRPRAAPPPRPRPAINDDSRFFWEGVERGELLIQRCAGCGALRHPPRPMCHCCRGLEWDTVRASGRGTVHSYVVPRQPRLPAFPEPYVVVLVDLEEGTRLVSNLVEIEPDAVRIGMPVELAVTRVDGELTLPLFRPQRISLPPRGGGSGWGGRLAASSSGPPHPTSPTRGEETEEVGEELPELVIEITPTLIVAGAIASRDYQDVHHDEARARERGVPGIFMNILTTNGLVGRFVTDWAGPDAVVRRIDIRLGAPNFAGDVMRLSGRATSAAARDGEGVVEIEVCGRNRLGDHVTGTVTVALHR